MSELSVMRSQGRTFGGRKASVLLLMLVAATLVLALSSTGRQLLPPFFFRTAGFDISWSLMPFEPADPYAKVFLVGAVNTLFLAVIAVFLGVILGIGVGVARRSVDAAVRVPARVFTDTLVNTPLILQVLVWYLGVFTLLPQPRQSLLLGDWLAFNNRGLFLSFPVFETGAGFAATIVLLTVLAMAAATATRWSRHGRPRQWQWAITGFAGLVVVAVSTRLRWESPILEGFNYSGGVMVPSGLCVMVVALTLNNAAYVGEIVRSGLGAVPAGQTEAGLALGLRRFTIFRKIVLPQAIRIVIPPLISQAQDVFKNCALSIVVGFPDLVSVWTNIALNQSGRATEILFTTILFYLAGGIVVSACLSLYRAGPAKRGMAR